VVALLADLRDDPVDWVRAAAAWSAPGATTPGGSPEPGP
jgi:hypothetical protein